MPFFFAAVHIDNPWPSRISMARTQSSQPLIVHVFARKIGFVE